MKICVVDGCNNSAIHGRKLCKQHEAIRRQKAYAEKKANGEKYRTLYDCVCLVCKKQFKGWRKSSFLCSKNCYKQYAIEFSPKTYNKYEYDSENYHQHKHRNIAEQVLERRLDTNEVVHHIDGNPKNNSLDNLIVLSRSKHTSLHSFLCKQRALLEQSNNGNNENCWNTLIDQITTTWLEMASVKVKKLSEIGQSAAKLLSDGEGSETMHVASHRDDDIVQTTTENISG